MYRYANSTREVLERASKIAGAIGVSYLGTEHILDGILQVD